MGIQDNMYLAQEESLQELLNDQCDEEYELTMADVKRFYLEGRIDFIRSLELQLETVEYKYHKRMSKNES